MVYILVATIFLSGGSHDLTIAAYETQKDCEAAVEFLQPRFNGLLTCEAEI